MVTALGDMGTLPTLFLATFITRNHAVNAVVATVCVVVCIYSLVRAITTDLKPVRRIVTEMVAVILLTPFLDIAAGAILPAQATALTALPGSPVDLRFFFGLEGDKIESLEIVP